VPKLRGRTLVQGSDPGPSNSKKPGRFIRCENTQPSTAEGKSGSGLEKKKTRANAHRKGGGGELIYLINGSGEKSETLSLRQSTVNRDFQTVKR